MSELYSVSVDWFQVSCTRDVRQSLSEGMYVYGTATTDSGRELCYAITAAKEFNALFGNCLCVRLHGFPLATIYCEPRPSSIPASLCLIKMSNPVLYSARWMWYLCDIMAALKWQFKSVSRIDLCCDFNYFAGHLAPTEFIRRYLESGPWNPSIISYWRVHGNRYTIIGEKKNISEDVRNLSASVIRHDVEYLRFGQRTSGVCTYLYNKTRELSVKKNKLYIRDHWAKVGLVDTDEVPVYRLEISVSNAASRIQVNDSDEVKNEKRAAKSMYEMNLSNFSVRALSLNDFATAQSIETMFWAYANHYFRFKRVGPQKSRQKWEDVPLFDAKLTTDIKPYLASYPLNSGVRERNAASCLEHVLYHSSDLSIEEQVSIDNAISILRRLSQTKSLTFDEQTEKRLQKALDKGWTWEDLERRRILPRRLLSQLRDLVENAATRELMFVRRDAQAARAMDELFATYEMLGEDVEFINNLPNNELL